MARLTLQHLAGNTHIIPAPATIGIYVRDGRAVLIDSGNDEEAGRPCSQHRKLPGSHLRGTGLARKGGGRISEYQYLCEKLKDVQACKNLERLKT